MSLQPMGLVLVLLLLFGTAVPVRAIGFDSDAILRQGDIDRPNRDLVLYTVSNLAAIQFIHEELLDGCRAVLLRHECCRMGAVALPRAESEFRQLCWFYPYLFAAPFTVAWNAGPQWVIRTSNAALGFMGTGRRTVTRIRAALGDIKRGMAYLTYMRYARLPVPRLLSNVSRRCQLDILPRLRFGATDVVKVGGTGMATEPTSPDSYSVCSGMNFSSAIETIRCDVHSASITQNARQCKPQMVVGDRWNS